MKAKVTCVCGRTHTINPENGADQPLCKCGATLRIEAETDGGELKYRPFANVPDGYDLTHRKYNRPQMEWQK